MGCTLQELDGIEPMKLTVWVAGMLLLAAPPLGAGEKLAMRVSPTLSSEPANLVIQVLIERDSANRLSEVAAESDDYYRASQVPLDGDRAPWVTRFEYRDLPAGAYQVTAILVGGGNKVRGLVKQQVTVVSSGAR